MPFLYAPVCALTRIQSTPKRIGCVCVRARAMCESEGEGQCHFVTAALAVAPLVCIITFIVFIRIRYSIAS